MILAELNEIIVNTSKTSPLVKEAFAGDVYDINSKENRFGCFVATPMSALRNNSGSVTYTYTMFYIDRLTQDESNMDLVQSDAVNLLKSLISHFDNESGFEVATEYQFTLFRHNFDDWCAGAYIEVDITVPDMDCDYEVGKYIELRPITITENGKYEPVGFDGYSSVIVNVDVEGRIAELEEQIAGLEHQKSELEEQKAELERQKAELEEQNSELNGQIDGLQSEVEELNTQIAELEEHIELLNTQIAGLQSEVVELNTQIAGLQSEVARMSQLQDIDITENGEYSADADHYALGRVSVNVKGLTPEQEELINQIPYKADKSEIPSLDGYATEEYVDSQGFLTEHQHIKTINGQSLIGDGNITVQAGVPTFIVEYTSTFDESGNEILTVDENTCLELKAFLDENNIDECQIYMHLEDSSFSLMTGKYYDADNGYISLYNDELNFVTQITDGVVDMVALGYMQYSTNEVGAEWTSSPESVPFLSDGGLKPLIVESEDGSVEYGVYQYNGSTGEVEKIAKEEWVEGKGYLTEHQPLKTINGQSLIGDGNIVIGGGEASLPSYILDDHIEFLNGSAITYLDGSTFTFHDEGYQNEMNLIRHWYSGEGYGSVMFGLITTPGLENHYGVQAISADETKITDISSNGITFIDYDQTTEEGEIDWNNPTIHEVSRESLINMVSSDNLKTINGQSLIGTGDLVVGGVGMPGTGLGAEIFNAYGLNGERANTASGEYSHAEGQNSKATGRLSHSEGNSTAEGHYSHAEGQQTTATGQYSHTEGYQTKVDALCDGGHAEGKSTRTSAKGGHAEGIYNVYNNSAFQHCVGIGTGNSNRKNAHTILSTGEHYIIGVGGYLGTETDITGVKDVATVINGKMDSSLVWTGSVAEWTALTDEQKASYLIALITE